VYVVSGALRDVIIDSLEFIEDILYRLHHDRLQRPRKRIRIIRIVLLQHKRRLSLLLFSHLTAGLTLQHEIRDRELVRTRRGLALRRIVVFLSDVMQKPADGIPNGMFCIAWFASFASFLKPHHWP
jgi:hypothetical protein